jgi:hypothetical protein
MQRGSLLRGLLRGRAGCLPWSVTSLKCAQRLVLLRTSRSTGGKRTVSLGWRGPFFGQHGTWLCLCTHVWYMCVLVCACSICVTRVVYICDVCDTHVVCVWCAGGRTGEVLLFSLGSWTLQVTKTPFLT